jgi:hypothetical protein
MKHTLIATAATGALAHLFADGSVIEAPGTPARPCKVWRATRPVQSFADGFSSAVVTQETTIRLLAAEHPGAGPSAFRGWLVQLEGPNGPEVWQVPAADVAELTDRGLCWSMGALPVADTGTPWGDAP